MADKKQADETERLRSLAADFTPVNWHEAWDAQPEQVDWLIEPIIEAGQSVDLFAPPGTGKSLLALEWGAGLSAGWSMLGNRQRDPVNVVYVDAENRRPDLIERLQAFGYKPADLDRLTLFSFPDLAALDHAYGGQQLLALALTYEARLVIIDTTSRVVAGPENDADTYNALYRHSITPLRSRGIAMLRLDHPGKNVAKGPRGSSAKTGDVDSEWFLGAKAGSLTDFTLERSKNRAGHGADTLTIQRKIRPLRHVLAGDRIDQLAETLDELLGDKKVGRDRAAKLLRDSGIRARTEDIGAALGRRKNLSPAYPRLTVLPGTENLSPDHGTGKDGVS